MLHCRTPIADWGWAGAFRGQGTISKPLRLPGLCSCCFSPEIFWGRQQERPASLERPCLPGSAHSIDCRIAFQEWGLDTPNQFAKSQFPKWSIHWMTNLPWVEGSFFFFFFHCSFPATVHRSSGSQILHECRSTFRISQYKGKCAPPPGCLALPYLACEERFLSKHFLSSVFPYRFDPMLAFGYQQWL